MLTDPHDLWKRASRVIARIDSEMARARALDDDPERDSILEELRKVRAATLRDRAYFERVALEEE